MLLTYRRIAMGIVIALVAGQSFGQSAAQDIVIGQCAPLSGSLAGTGADLAFGVKLAVESANAAGGINGRKIRLVQKDDGYQTDKTVQCTEELIQNHKAVALIGYAGTGNVAELLKRKILSDANIALVAPYTGGEALRDPYNANIFHIRASYADEAAKMVDQFSRSGLRRIAVFYQNDAFGQSGLAGVERALAKQDSRVVAKSSYEKNTENVAQAVAEIAKSEPQAVIMIAITRPAAAFVKLLQQYSPGTQVFSISVINGEELYKLAGDEGGRGVGITQVMPSPFSGTLPVVREYVQVLKKFSPSAKPSYASLEEYIGARVLIEGLKRVNGPITSAAVMNALGNLNTEIGGYKVSFGPNLRSGSKFVEVSLIGKEGMHMR